MVSQKELNRRLGKLQSALKRRKLDAMIVFDRFNAFYMTGFKSSLSYLLVTPKSALLLVDGRYIEAARATVKHCEVELFKKIGDSFASWNRDHRPKRVGFEGAIPWSAWKQFSEWLPGVQWIESGDLLMQMRIRKSPEEIKAIAQSAKVNDEVYESAIASIHEGFDEIDLRNVIHAESDRRGVDGLSFECIVASGAAGSMPHYRPAHNAIQRGDLLLIDMGMLVDGYCSDMTRVVSIGAKPKARLQRAFDAVLEAEEAALKKVGPGVKCADLHRIATEKLKRRGFAKYFTHGLGHGVGLEIHEKPVLNAISSDVLEPGMVVTIEPGVYLPGLGGVRIEDMVVVTNNGCRVLSQSPKKFRIVPFAG